MARTKMPGKGPASTRQVKKALASKKPASAKKPPPPKKKLVPKGKGKKAVEDTLIRHIVFMSEERQILGYTTAETNPPRFLMYTSEDEPPSSPMPPNPFTDVKEYSFLPTADTLSPKAHERYLFFLDVERLPEPLLFPDVGALESLGVREVTSILKKSGLDFLLQEDPGTHTELVLEFMGGLEVLRSDGEISGWKFFMGGLVWEVDSATLRRWFSFPIDGNFPYVIPDTSVHDFWKKITGRDWKSDKSRKSSRIKMPVWTLIHRFLSNVFFLRTDAGTHVKKVELALMAMMDKEQKIDWLAALSLGLEANLSRKDKNKHLGGGSFITRIATKLLFVLDEEDLRRSSLDLAGMKLRRIVSKDLRWINTFEGNDESSDEESSEREGGLRMNVDPPLIQTTDIPSTSSHPPPPSVIDQKLDLILAHLGALSGRVSGLECKHTEILQNQATILAILQSFDAPEPDSPHETPPPSHTHEPRVPSPRASPHSSPLPYILAPDSPTLAAKNIVEPHSPLATSTVASEVVEPLSCTALAIRDPMISDPSQRSQNITIQEIDETAELEGRQTEQITSTEDAMEDEAGKDDDAAEKQISLS